MSSMKDVAKLAGVSISTVSRVVNQSIPVDGETRRKVKEAIRKLDYRPNLLAKGLRLRSGHMIGLVVPRIVPSHAFANIIQYTEECASRHQFNLILGNHYNNPDIEEQFISSLLQRNVDGIIFSRVSDESRAFKVLHKRNIPVVVIDRVLENENIPSVAVNNYMAGEIVAKHFVELGHKHIACISGPQNIALCRERIDGLKRVLQEHGLVFDERYLVEGNFEMETGLRGISTLLERQKNITAVWAHNDAMAAGVMKELYRRNIKVPEDISVIGMDDISLARMVSPELTTIHQPFKEMSEKAVEMILMQKKDIVLPEKRVILNPSLVVRESTTHAK